MAARAAKARIKINKLLDSPQRLMTERVGTDYIAHTQMPSYGFTELTVNPALNMANFKAVAKERRDRIPST